MKKINHSIRVIQKRLVVVTLASAYHLCTRTAPAFAVNSNWLTNVGSGNWSLPSNWSLGVPTQFTTVNIVHADSINRIVVYDNAGTNNRFATFNLNNTGSGGDVLSFGDDKSISANIENVGFNGGSGGFNQMGGTHTLDALILGNQGGTGAASLSAGMLQVGTQGDYIGKNTKASSGVFIQSGGTHITQSHLYVGSFKGNGRYDLSNGTLAVPSGSLWVGYDHGVGVFNQSGGSVSSFWLSIGAVDGTGTYNMDGGTVTLGEALNIGDWQNNSVNTSGTLNMTGGTITAALAFVGKGYNSTGLLVQSGGTIVVTAPRGLSISGGLFGNTHVSGTYQLLGGVLASSGTGILNLNDNGAFLVSANATIVGFGPFNQTGGTANFAGTLNISANGGGAVTSYNQTGGTFTAPSVINSGTFNSTNGTASVGALTGTGSLTVGGGTGTALVYADSLNQTNVTVDTGGTLNIGPASGLASPVNVSGALTITNAATVSFTPTSTPVTTSGVKTNFVKTLNIGTNGLLDIQNHFVSIDNTATPLATVHQYIDAVYNRNAATGFGDYAGRGGIGSSVVKASADFMSIGYYDGALQDPANPDYVGQILGPNSNSGHGTGLPPAQILVRPTLTGDLNGDGVVDSYDVNLFNSFGLFNQPTTLGYQAGDLNGDGVVDFKDVKIFNSAGNFNTGRSPALNAAARLGKGSTTLTGRAANHAAAQLNPASGTVAFSYDPATGDVIIRYNGFTGFAGKQTFNTTTRALSLIDIASTGGAFALDGTKLSNASQTDLSGMTLTGNTEINMTAVNGYLPDCTDLGPILAKNLDPQGLADALTLTFNYTGSRQLSGGVAGLIVPEPTTLSLMGLGTIALLARRRRNSVGIF